ncbi:MAG TPA: hypothetical protein VK917_08615, partial [Ilumatobacter sp.]|nr:hypothetical protein [Ilumatobacter sp.]
MTDAATSRDDDRSGPLRAHRGGSVVFRALVVAQPGTVGTVNDADTERRSRLLGLKLRALVRDHL